MASAEEGKTEGGRKPRQDAPPTTSVVSLTCLLGEGGCTIAEAMVMSKKDIDLAEIGITDIVPKRAITVGLLLEIKGEDNSAKANTLAEKMKEALRGKRVTIGRPCKTTDLRLSGLEDVDTAAEVRQAVSKFGAVNEGEVRTGEIRRAPNGLGTIWVRCLMTAAKRLADAKRIMVGWACARVDILPPRPIRCVRCMEARITCKAEDRSGRCYRCGQPGHVSAKCSGEPICALCASIGRPSGLMYGGKACAPPLRRRGGVVGTRVAKPPSSHPRRPSVKPSAQTGGKKVGMGTEDMDLNPTLPLPKHQGVSPNLWVDAIHWLRGVCAGVSPLC